MDALKMRTLPDGRNLGNGILKVDGFINRQVAPVLLAACGRELAGRFGNLRATKVLTAEISGIAPALTTALHLGIPIVYARKTKPITMPNQVFLTLAPSHTKGRMVELIVSQSTSRRMSACSSSMISWPPGRPLPGWPSWRKPPAPP